VSIKDEFDAYRDRAMRGNEASLESLNAGFAALKVFIMEDWPEVAASFADKLIRFREVGIGHRNGSLVELTYDVGTDALGWRTYDMSFNRDSLAWVPTRRGPNQTSSRDDAGPK
jgi:hypothetical protein